MGITKTAMLEQMEREAMEEALCWKYNLNPDDDNYEEQLAYHKRKLRQTDIQDIIWEYEDHQDYMRALERDT